MDNSFFLPNPDDKGPCRPLYFSYSIGFLLSKLPTLNCGPQEGYTYQLAKSLNNRIDDAKYLKMSLTVEPCATKHLSLQALDFRLVLALYMKTECGRVSLSINNEDNFFPMSTFMVDMGYLVCGNQEQVIDSENRALTNLYFKSMTKQDISDVTLVVVGI